MSQPDTDKALAAEERTEEVRSFVRTVRTATRRKCRAHCPTIGNEGCSRSTISRRRPGSWTGLLGQEIPFHLQLADLLVQPGDQSGVALGLLVLTVADTPAAPSVRTFFQA